MRTPARVLSSNLMFTRDGQVWATWQVRGLPYGQRPEKEKRNVRAIHAALFRCLPRESMLLSSFFDQSAQSVVDRMSSGIDLNQHEDWALECEASWDLIEEWNPGDRLYFVSAPLALTGPDRFLQPLRASWANMKDSAGIPRAPIPADQLRRWQEAADDIQAAIPAPCRAKPVNPAQMVWIYRHAQQRGLGLDHDFPAAVEQDGAQFPAAALGEPVLDEGGHAELSRKDLRKIHPGTRRFVTVTSDRPSAPTSYQSLLILGETPSDGFNFPGEEILGSIDEAGMDIDWTLRNHASTRQSTMARMRKAQRNINEQFRQRETSNGDHSASALDKIEDELLEYVALMNADENEIGLQATFILCASGATAQQATGDAKALAAEWDKAGFGLGQPLGSQLDLWWAMLPGSPTTKVISEWAQTTTSKDLAATAPLASSELGDRTGMLLGLNRTTGRESVVLLNIEAATTKRNRSGCIAIAGELGAGKSFLMKKIAGAVVDRGGQFIAVDRTDMGEWGLYADSITDAQVVTVLDPLFSMDPLRVFGLVTGGPLLQSYLTRLLNVEPMSQTGVLIDSLLQPDYLIEHELTSLADVTDWVSTGDGKDLPGAHDLSTRLQFFNTKRYARTMFDRDLPPVDPTVSALIIGTAGIETPTANELQSAHLFRQITPEKIFGRAFNAYLSGFGRAVCFRDRNRLAAFFGDECYHLTESPEGYREYLLFIKDGRKHNAIGVYGGHAPHMDFGPPEAWGFIPVRIVGRLDSKEMAIQGAAFIGAGDSDEVIEQIMALSPQDPETEKVVQGREGEFQMRDASGNIGMLQVLRPARDQRFEAVLTTPTSDGGTEDVRDFYGAPVLAGAR